MARPLSLWFVGSSTAGVDAETERLGRDDGPKMLGGVCVMLQGDYLHTISGVCLRDICEPCDKCRD